MAKLRPRPAAKVNAVETRLPLGVCVLVFICLHALLSMCESDAGSEFAYIMKLIEKGKVRKMGPGHDPSEDYRG